MAAMSRADHDVESQTLPRAGAARSGARRRVIGRASDCNPKHYCWSLSLLSAFAAKRASVAAAAVTVATPFQNFTASSNTTTTACLGSTSVERANERTHTHIVVLAHASRQQQATELFPQQQRRV